MLSLFFLLFYCKRKRTLLSVSDEEHSVFVVFSDDDSTRVLQDFSSICFLSRHRVLHREWIANELCVVVKEKRKEGTNDTTWDNAIMKNEWNYTHIVSWRSFILIFSLLLDLHHHFPSWFWCHACSEKTILLDVLCFPDINLFLISFHCKKCRSNSKWKGIASNLKKQMKEEKGWTFQVQDLCPHERQTKDSFLDHIAMSWLLREVVSFLMFQETRQSVSQIDSLPFIDVDTKTREMKKRKRNKISSGFFE
jgi:hypothetical protein